MVVAGVSKALADAITKVVVHHTRECNPTGFREGLQPGGDVYTFAIDVGSFADDIPDIDTYSKQDAFRFENRLVDLGHANLDRKRAGNRANRTWKFHKNTIAHELHDAPRMLANERFDDVFTQLLHSRDGAGLVGLH